MPRHAPVLAASLLAVLVVLLLDLAGTFGAINQRLMDTQQRLLPRETGPYSDDIVLVDVDDGSIDRLGRWPWPRSTLADAINELRLAGAKTIALDIEFSNPQDPTWDAQAQAPRDEDSVLAESIDDAAILATVLAADELEVRWTDAGGDREALDRLVMALVTDITATPEQPPPDVDLDEDDLSAFAANHLLVKRRAILEALSVDEPPGSLESLEARLVPARHLHGATYPERPLLEAAWLQHDGLAMADEFFTQHDENLAGSSSDRVPLRDFLDGAGGLGYVNITHRGPDGAVRSIYPAQPVRGGRVLSLGLAAVAHFLDLPPEEVVISSDMVEVGDSTIPLHDEQVWLSWPRSETGWRWRDLHRRDASDPEYRGHLSISEIVEIGRARRTLAKLQDELAATSQDLMQVIRQDSEVTMPDWLAAEVQEEIENEVAFNLEGVSLDDEPDDFAAGEDDETLRLLTAMQQWRRISRAIEEDVVRLERSTATLASQVDGALVFVGWTSTGAAADFISTVAGPRTPGVLVHATLADMVLQDRALHLADAWVSPVVIIGLGLLVAILVATLGPWWATATSLVSILVYVGSAGVLALSLGGFILPIATPVLSGLAAWICGTGVQAAMAQRDKRRITRQFRARVSDQLVDALIADPDAVSMTGVSREMTILFADLAGFTRLSESLGSEQVVRILNTYLSALTSQMVEHGAYVNKFLGDGVMAFWSAFREEPAQAHLACAAALACQDTMARLNELTTDEHPAIGLRVGLATGIAVVGDCGAPPDLNDYTVIGDTANLAARLESANKQFGTGVLVNDRTHECLADAPVRCRLVGSIQVVGRQAPVRAWEVVDSSFPQEAIDLSMALDEAVSHGDRAAAAAALANLRNLPDQESFVARWAEMVEGPPEDFGGPLRLIEK